MKINQSMLGMSYQYKIQRLGCVNMKKCKCGNEMVKKNMEYMQKTKKALTICWVCKKCGTVTPIK